MATAHEELIQNFDEVRHYVRSLFIYGFKSINDFSKQKSRRTYSTHLTRIKNWLRPFCSSFTTANNEKVNYIKIKSRGISNNPLYLPLKSHIFKDNQISILFYMLDLLKENPDGLSKTEILEQSSKYRNFVFADFEQHKDNWYLYYSKRGLLKYNSNNNTYTFNNIPLNIDLPDDNRTSAQLIYTVQDILASNFMVKLLGSNINEIVFNLQKAKNVSFKNGYYTFSNERIVLKDLIGNKTFTEQAMKDLLQENKYEFYQDCGLTETILTRTLKEMENLGLVTSSRKSANIYKLTTDIYLDENLLTAIQFFSEVDGLGFLGSTLLDLQDENTSSPFIFKHHYLANALNMEMLYHILEAISQHKIIRLYLCDSKKFSEVKKSEVVVPLKLYRSVETGRIHLLTYYCKKKRYDFFLLDNIEHIENVTSINKDDLLAEAKVEIKKIHGKKQFYCTNYDDLLINSITFTKYIWSMSTSLYKDDYPQPSTVKVIFQIGENEEYIKNRLIREKRQGQLSFNNKEHTATYSITLFNPWEMFPWLRSYITRIKKISFTDPKLEEIFLKDFQSMLNIYSINKEEHDNA